MFFVIVFHTLLRLASLVGVVRARGECERRDEPVGRAAPDVREIRSGDGDTAGRGWVRAGSGRVGACGASGGGAASRNGIARAVREVRAVLCAMPLKGYGSGEVRASA